MGQTWPGSILSHPLPHLALGWLWGKGVKFTYPAHNLRYTWTHHWTYYGFVLLLDCLFVCMFVLTQLLATMLLTEPFNKWELTSAISILYYTEFSAVQEQWVQTEGCANPAISPYHNSCLVLSPVISADQWKWGRKPVQITAAWRTRRGPGGRLCICFNLSRYCQSYEFQAQVTLQLTVSLSDLA